MSLFSIILAALIVIIVLCNSPLGSNIVSIVFMFAAIILFGSGIYGIVKSEFLAGFILLICSLICYIIAEYVYNLYSWSEHYFNTKFQGD